MSNKNKKKLAPYKKQLNLRHHYLAQRYDLAEKVGLKLTKKYPNDQFSFNILSLVYRETNRLSEAFEFNKKAISIAPNDPMLYNNLGNFFKDAGKKEEAEKNYKYALSIDNQLFLAHKNLGVLFHTSGRKDEALASYSRALEIDSDPEIKHLYSSISGEGTSLVNIEYSESLFDARARGFEEELVEKLDYNAPKIIADILTEHNGNSLGSILDLGCGTGLFGKEIRSFCNKLVGVDISKKMLEEAKKKEIYDDLIKSEIVNYLSEESLDYDIFICLDTLIYIGDLSEIFNLIKNKNKVHGKFVFTTEHNEKEDICFEETGRYSHSKSYIEKLCKEFNYNLTYFKTINLRKEKKVFLIGGIYILDFECNNI